MTTYRHFTDAAPNVSQHWTSALEDTSNSLKAARDAVAIGTFPGWTFRAFRGRYNVITVASCTWTKNYERVKATLGYNDASGCVTSAVYSYTKDYLNPDYVTFGKNVITYDTSANVVSTTWSDLP